MADPKKDDIADALAAFAAGDAAEPDAATPTPPNPRPAPLPQRPPSRISQAVAKAPSSRLRTPQPIAQPLAQTAYVPEQVEEVEGAEEDPPAAMGAGAPTSASVPVRRQNYAPNLEARRTLIPILLTCGVLLLVFAVLKYVMGPDSPFASMPGVVTGSAVGMGVLLLIAAAVNMLGVKSALRHAQR